jgi:hypothetical protein
MEKKMTTNFRPYLIQRMSYKLPKEDQEPKTKLNSTSVDHYFRQDYMGSAEFEWGALPGTLKQWRKAKDILITQIQVDLYMFYLVAPKTTVDSYLTQITQWWKGECTGKPLFRLKETTNVKNWKDNSINDRYDGWWSVDFRDEHHSRQTDGTPWLFAIFKDPEHAKIWKHCVTNKNPVNPVV